MDLKKQSFQKRLAAGNKVAELIRKYLVNRFGEDISDLSGTTGDIKDGIDFGIFQCKVRFSKYGNDIIFEAVKFIPKSVGKIVPPYTTTEGRDAHGKSKYTICMPVSQDRLLLPKTKDIIKQYQKALKEWGIGTIMTEAKNGSKCMLVMKDDKDIFENWVTNARNAGNQSYLAFKKEGVQIWFKIDEGSDGKPYGKLLAYISVDVFKNCGCIMLRKDEKINDPNTWKRSKGEKLEDYLL